MIAQNKQYPNGRDSSQPSTGPQIGAVGLMPQPANDIRRPLNAPAFPPGTTAWIYRPAKSPFTSGLANVCHWLLEFEPAGAPSIDPLIGWYGGGDTLQQVQLKFPSKEAAIGYARRHGLSFVVQDEAPAEFSRCPPERAVAVPSHWTVFRAMSEPEAALVHMDMLDSIAGRAASDNQESAATSAAA